MTTLNDDLATVWGWLTSGAKPDLQMFVSEWAELHRILPEHSPEPGPWRNDRTPYLRQIMDCLSPKSTIERVVVQKGAQLGFTSAGDNWIGFNIAHAPGVTLMALPSFEDVKKAVTTRVDPLIDSTPLLRRLVKKAKGRRRANSMTRKEFPGGVILFTSATSPKGLRSTAARYLFLDEVDGYPGNVGEEGDPVFLAEQRTVAFRGRRKIFLLSTPTLKGLSRIEKAYEESDRRIYEVPCVGCGVLSPIMWKDIVWPKGRPHMAEWQCPECSRAHPEHLKGRLLRNGEWRATAEGDGSTAGFFISGLYSPFEPWGEVAKIFVNAGKDPSLLQAWTNTRLGEAFEDRSGELIEAAEVQSKSKSWDRQYLPAGVVVLIAAVDVQDDRLELAVWGFGAGEQTWLIEYRVIEGSPAVADVWQDLDAALRQTYPHSLAVPDIPIMACCIDTGGHHTRQVYNFVRDKAERRIWAVKGHHLPAKPIWPRRPSFTQKGRVPLYMVGTDSAKETIYARLKIAEPGPGYINFPGWLPEKFYRGLVSERVVTKYVKGRPQRVWVLPSGRRNEPLDLAVYGLAGLYGIQALNYNLDAEAAKLVACGPRKAAEPVPVLPPKKKSNVVARFRFD